MDRKKRRKERINSLGWFLLSLVLLAVGFVIIIPTLQLYGILWTFVAALFAIYHGYNVFGKKKFSMWDVETTIDQNEGDYGKSNS